MTQVSDLMSGPVVSCRADASLGEVAALLAERQIHGVVVLDDAGRPAGVVADTDLLAGEWLATNAESDSSSCDSHASSGACWFAATHRLMRCSRSITPPCAGEYCG